jgi:flagellar biosynthesis component FlhA
VGHEEVAERLAELDEALRLPADALTDLVQVIRALLREGIMVTPFAEIVEEYSAAVTDGFSLARIVERLRGIPAVLAQLPGRDARHVPFRLTERAERALEEAIEDDGRHPALALRPGRQRQALRAVQNLLTAEPRAVLVVERDSLRPWLRALIRDRHPGVPVLARRELAGDPAAGAMKEIDLWPERVQ